MSTIWRSICETDVELAESGGRCGYGRGQGNQDQRGGGTDGAQQDGVSGVWEQAAHLSMVAPISPSSELENSEKLGSQKKSYQVFHTCCQPGIVLGTSHARHYQVGTAITSGQMGKLSR